MSAFPGFLAWLKLQHVRHDPIGDLAGMAISDPELEGREMDFDQLLRHVRARGAHDLVVAIVLEARIDYEQARERFAVRYQLH